MDKRIAVLVPCLNEGQTVGKVVCDWYQALLPWASERDYGVRVYVYDNGSSDDTVAEAVSAAAFVAREPKPGKGNVVRRMFREIKADCYIMVDGDDTYPSSAAVKMAEAVLEHGADMAVGDRLSTTYRSENTRVFHSFGNALVRRMIQALFREKVTDAMTGLRAFSYRFVGTFPVMSGGFQLETEMSIHCAAHRLRVLSIPIEYHDRKEGSRSKLRTVPDGARVLRMIFRMWRDYRPMGFFGSIGTALFLLAAWFFIPVLKAYLATGQVSRFPTLIVCCFTATAGLLSVFTGAVLKVLRMKDLRDFELKYARTHKQWFPARTRPTWEPDFKVSQPSWDTISSLYPCTLVHGRLGEEY